MEANEVGAAHGGLELIKRFLFENSSCLIEGISSC